MDILDNGTVLPKPALLIFSYTCSFPLQQHVLQDEPKIYCNDGKVVVKFQQHTDSTYDKFRQLQGALDNILKFSSRLNFIYEVNIDC